MPHNLRKYSALRIRAVVNLYRHIWTSGTVAIGLLQVLVAKPMRCKLSIPIPGLYVAIPDGFLGWVQSLFQYLSVEYDAHNKFGSIYTGCWGEGPTRADNCSERIEMCTMKFVIGLRVDWFLSHANR